ncbi:hypothetical protein [Stackebrandtia nassauensis]|uniref:Uncharacterized protein n=1 Tax=Stackebrandtia nassauensis (strain DSM 44728 / CIP 108903 / NRRL B-16338 / NBRC 102104 / LLR-40K-21) TaxID=446470 RepID=D3QA99_STANL|nr:hypothetical protein [Stackebrandtia nassauensis]ADD40811.1 hypothetical protein Snas_1101 [Stackebrandtia nassauensis DSM 44728]
MIDIEEMPQRVVGDGVTAVCWIEDAALSDEDELALRRFVGRFPSLRFARDTPAVLDRHETVDQVTLPAWFRVARTILAGLEPAGRVRLDAFAIDGSPRETPREYYEISPGYINEEIRGLLFDKAGVYLIGQEFGDDESCLAIDLENPRDRRIFEFAMEDLLDDDIADRPLRKSLTPVFSSYADLLGHIVAARMPDGEIVIAADQGRWGDVRWRA